MGATGRYEAPTRHGISIESQLLAIVTGFVVFIVVIAVFAAIQQRRRRRASREFQSPLIQPFNTINKQRFRATSRNLGSNSSSNEGSPVPTLSPTDSNTSPQCISMTPYDSFSSHAELPIHHHHGQQQYSTERGSLSLALDYNKTTKALQISIISGHNLPELVGPFHNGQSNLNPYVKIRVLPDNQHRMKTRILRNTRNPFYDEQFTLYGVTSEQLQTYTLHLAVIASDHYNRDIVLGEAFVNLAETERCRDMNDNESDNILELELYPRPAYVDVHAQVFVSIAYNQLTNSVNFAVLKMKDLPSDERIGQIDAYVKVYMLVNGQRVARHKTHVKKAVTEPIFNESFGFDLPSTVGDGSIRSVDQILGSLSFEVQVLNHNGVTRNELVGQCMISKESKHLKAAFHEQAGQQVSEWHRIKSQ